MSLVSHVDSGHKQDRTVGGDQHVETFRQSSGDATLQQSLRLVS